MVGSSPQRVLHGGTRGWRGTGDWGLDRRSQELPKGSVKMHGQVEACGDDGEVGELLGAAIIEEALGRWRLSTSGTLVMDGDRLGVVARSGRRRQCSTMASGAWVETTVNDMERQGCGRL
jgi:hypothetical protein